MALKERERAIIAAKARSIINEHGAFIEEVIAEVRKETEGPINKETSDAIALEYMRREGIKEGLTLFMKRLNAKTHE